MKILFSEKKDWEENIRSVIDMGAYFPYFSEFDGVKLADFDFIVPLKIGDYKYLVDMASKALIPNEIAVNLCQNKIIFNNIIGNGDFRFVIPEIIDKWEIMRSLGSDAAYPFIMKKNEDLFGMKSFVIDSAEDVVAHLPCLRDDSYFCQVYVDGASEITTHILMYRGEIIYHCNVVYEMMSGPYVRGERASPKSHVINHDQWHLSLFRSILNSIGFRDGICCVNYKLQDGVPKIFEINPRFGGSLCLDINRFLEAYIGALRQR